MLNAIKIVNQFLDFNSILVFDSEIFGLSFKVSNLSSYFILLLNVSDQLIKVLFKLADLLVDFFCVFVFFGFVEDEIFNLNIQSFDIVYDSLGASLNLSDFLKDSNDFNFLLFQIVNDFINSF